MPTVPKALAVAILDKDPKLDPVVRIAFVFEYTTDNHALSLRQARELWAELGDVLGESAPRLLTDEQWAGADSIELTDEDIAEVRQKAEDLAAPYHPRTKKGFIR